VTDKKLLAFSASLLVLMAATTQARSETTGNEIGEVVVTAERREANLQDVPIAISAYTAETRQIVGLDTLQDYTNFTPGLSYSSSNDRVFVRGIGRQTNTNGSDPGVATYSDGVYNAATASAGASDLFLDRVEILRGPQGTLYGRNSIGGAINAISKRPTETLSGDLRLTVGDYKVLNFEGAVSGPLADGLRARLAAARYHQGDGYFENVAGGRSEGGVTDRTYVELQLEADLGPNVDAWVKVFGADYETHPRSAAMVSAYDNAPFPNGYIAPGSGFGYLQPVFTQVGKQKTNPAVDDPRKFSANTPSQSNLDDSYGLATQVTWRLPGVDLKYIGGLQTYRITSVSEIDATDVTSYRYPLNPGNTCGFIPGCTAATIFPSQRFIYVEDKSFGSSELTLNSTYESPLQWIGGVYYYAEDLHQESHFNAPDQPQLKAPANGPPNPSGDFVTAISTLRTESYAVFGQADWSVTDTITLTGGLRYSHDKKSGDEALRAVCYGCVASLQLGNLGTSVPGIDITAATASLTAAPGASAPARIVASTGFAVRDLEGSWQATTGTAGIQWQPDRDTMAFLRYGRGYKSGGFNAGGISQFPRTDPEFVNSFEAGYKRTFGQTFQANVAVFHYSYKGLQVPLTVQENGINITRFFNLDKSRSDGFELETVWLATTDLKLMFNYAYSDSEIEAACCFVDSVDPLAVLPGAKPSGPSNGATQPQSLKGERLPQTPRHKFAVNASYQFNFDPGTLTLSASYSWRDDTYHVVFNRPYNQAPAYDQTDVRALWTDRDERYRVIAYVKNLFDQDGYDNATGGRRLIPAGVLQTYSLTPPRTWGVQVQYHF